MDASITVLLNAANNALAELIKVISVAGGVNEEPRLITGSL